MVTQPQSERAPDPPHISTPIALKLPIHIQPDVIPTSYGCEVIVPILLKIPIILQIDVSQRPPQCKPKTPKPHSSLAKANSVPTTSHSEPVERRSDTPSSSHLSNPDSLSSQPSSAELSSAENKRLKLSSFEGKRSEAESSKLESSKPESSEPAAIAKDIPQHPNRVHSKPLGKLDPKLHRFCPITILAILLGSLLGLGCSSLLVQHLATLNVDQHCAIASTNSASLALEDRCF